MVVIALFYGHFVLVSLVLNKCGAYQYPGRGGRRCEQPAAAEVADSQVCLATAGPSPGPSATAGTGAATPAAGTTSIQGYIFSIWGMKREGMCGRKVKKVI